LECSQNGGSIYQCIKREKKYQKIKKLISTDICGQMADQTIPVGQFKDQNAIREFAAVNHKT
jgi:hypothetical protein